MDTKEKIISVLEEMGIYLENIEDTTPLQEYIVDSIQFITFIISLEEKFSFVFPDEFLSYDSISTLGALCQIVEEAQHQ